MTEYEHVLRARAILVEVEQADMWDTLRLASEMLQHVPSILARMDRLAEMVDKGLATD